MPEFHDFVELKDVECIKQTPKAILVLIGTEQVWIPQSQVDDRSEVFHEGDEGTLVVSEWIYEEKLRELLEGENP